MPLKTVLSNYITLTVFGIVMGYSYKVLGTAVKQQRPLSFLAQPAAKHPGDDKGRQCPGSEDTDDI